MDQKLVNSNKITTEVHYCPFREKLKLYESPITPEKIIDVIDFQVQVLHDEGENFKKAVNDLNLETEEEEEAIPSFL